MYSINIHNSSQNTTKNNYPFTETYELILYHYAVPALCVLAVCLNFVIMMITFSLRKQNKIYTYLAVRSLLAALISLIHVRMQDNKCTTCSSTNFTRYFDALYRIYFLNIANYILATTLLCVEIYMISYRIYILYNKVNIVTKIRPIKILLSLILFSTVLFLPNFFVFSIDEDKPDTYYAKFNSFGESDYFFYYNITRMSLLCLLLVVFIFSTLKLIYLFRNYLKIRRQMNTRIQKENSLTRIILLLALGYSIPGFLYLVVQALQWFDRFTNINNNPVTSVLKSSNFFLIISTFIMNTILFLFNDSNLKKFLKQRLRLEFNFNFKVNLR